MISPFTNYNRYYRLFFLTVMLLVFIANCKQEQKTNTKIVYLPKGEIEVFQKKNKQFIKETVAKLEKVHKAVAKKKNKALKKKGTKVKSKFTIAADLKAAKIGKPNGAVVFATDLAKALGKKSSAKSPKKKKKKEAGENDEKPKSKPYFDNLGAGGPMVFAQAIGALRDKKQEERFSQIDSAEYTLKNLKKIDYLLVVKEISYEEPSTGTDGKAGLYEGNVFVFDISKKKPKAVGQFSFKFDGKEAPDSIEDGDLSKIKKAADKALNKFGAGLNNSLYKKMAKNKKIKVLRTKSKSQKDKAKKKKKKD